MLGWLWRKIVGRFGCDHKWKERHCTDVLMRGDVLGYQFFLSCEKCGDIKTRRFESN